jgi:hypothetical protein
MRDHSLDDKDARLAEDRAALADALAALKARFAAPGGAGGLGGGGGTAAGGLIAAAGAAVAGAGVAWFLGARTRQAGPVPEWLTELRRHEARADELLERIAAALAEERLAPDEAEAATDDVRAALAEERRRAMGRGLDGLAEDERSAVIDLRRRKAEGAGGLASHPMVTGVLAAAAAALVERGLRKL